jgi:hypothetical protein
MSDYFDSVHGVVKSLFGAMVSEEPAYWQKPAYCAPFVTMGHGAADAHGAHLIEIVGR